MASERKVVNFDLPDDDEVVDIEIHWMREQTPAGEALGYGVESPIERRRQERRGRTINRRKSRSLSPEIRSKKAPGKTRSRSYSPRGSRHHIGKNTLDDTHHISQSFNIEPTPSSTSRRTKKQRPVKRKKSRSLSPQSSTHTSKENATTTTTTSPARRSLSPKAGRGGRSSKRSSSQTDRRRSRRAVTNSKASLKNEEEEEEEEEKKEEKNSGTSHHRRKTGGEKRPIQRKRSQSLTSGDRPKRSTSQSAAAARTRSHSLSAVKRSSSSKNSRRRRKSGGISQSQRGQPRISPPSSNRRVTAHSEHNMVSSSHQRSSKTATTTTRKATSPTRHRTSRRDKAKQSTKPSSHSSKLHNSLSVFELEDPSSLDSNPNTKKKNKSLGKLHTSHAGRNMHHSFSHYDASSLSSAVTRDSKDGDGGGGGNRREKSGRDSRRKKEKDSSRRKERSPSDTKETKGEDQKDTSLNNSISQFDLGGSSSLLQRPKALDSSSRRGHTTGSRRSPRAGGRANYSNLHSSLTQVDHSSSHHANILDANHSGGVTPRLRHRQRQQNTSVAQAMVQATGGFDVEKLVHRDKEQNGASISDTEDSVSDSAQDSSRNISEEDPSKGGKTSKGTTAKKALKILKKTVLGSSSSSNNNNNKKEEKSREDTTATTKSEKPFYGPNLPEVEGI